MVTFVTRRKLPLAAQAELNGKTHFINHRKSYIIDLPIMPCRQSISLTCPHAGQAPPFVTRRKGGKACQRERRNPFRRFLLSLWKPSPLPQIAERLRAASARCLTLSIALGSSRDVGIFELKRQRRGEFPRRNRKHKRLWREPRIFLHALRGARTSSTHSIT